MSKAKLRGALRSVTIWVNAIFAVALANMPRIMDALQETMPSLVEFLPAEVYQGLGIALAIFGIYRRIVTTESLQEKGSK